MPPSFQYCSRCGIILKEISSKKKNSKRTQAIMEKTLKIETRPLSPTPTELPPGMKNQMMKLVNREGSSISLSSEKEIIGNIQLLELEMASVIDSVMEMNEKSNFIERKSFHTFHPDSIILPTISIPNGKVRKSVAKPIKTRKQNASILSRNDEGDYLSHIAPISIYYKQYVEREKLLKGLHAMAIDDDIACEESTFTPMAETKPLPPSEPFVGNNDQENASAWLWGSLGSLDKDGSITTFTDDFSFMSNDDGELNSVAPADEQSAMFWGNILQNDANDSEIKEFDDKEIDDEIKSIEKEEFCQEFFNFFGHYPADADMPDLFQVDSDGVRTTTVENYAKERKVSLAREAAAASQKNKGLARGEAGEGGLQENSDSEENKAGTRNVRGSELQKIKQLYNRSIRAISEEIDRISIDLRIDWQKKNKYFIRDLRQQLLLTKKVIASAAMIEVDAQLRYDEFKAHSSQRRSLFAMEVAKAMMAAAQVEATYREKYDLAVQAFKEKDSSSSGSKLQLSTQRHIVSNKQIDAIKEKAEAEMKRHGLIIQDLQSAESQLLLQIRLLLYLVHVLIAFIIGRLFILIILLLIVAL